MEYSCKKCNKQYSSYKSLWNHNKKFHTTQAMTMSLENKQNVMENKQNVMETNNNVIENIKEKYDVLTCKYCNKIFTARQNRWSHEKVCKQKNTNEIIEQNSNNHVNTNNGIINNTTNLNNVTIDNRVINKRTTNIIKFGTEDILGILNIKQIMNILNCRVLALEESIKTVHFNKQLPEYQNIRINNLRSNMALVHDGENFTVANQYNVINELIGEHVDAITQLVDEHKDKLTERTLDKLEKFIEKMDDSYKKIFDENSNRTFKNYKDFKISKVKEIIYNESKKIIK